MLSGGLMSCSGHVLALEFAARGPALFRACPDAAREPAGHVQSEGGLAPGERSPLAEVAHDCTPDAGGAVPPTAATAAAPHDAAASGRPLPSSLATASVTSTAVHTVPSSLAPSGWQGESFDELLEAHASTRWRLPRCGAHATSSYLELCAAAAAATAQAEVAAAATAAVAAAAAAASVLPTDSKRKAAAAATGGKLPAAVAAQPPPPQPPGAPPPRCSAIDVVLQLPSRPSSGDLPGVPAPPCGHHGAGTDVLCGQPVPGCHADVPAAGATAGAAHLRHARQQDCVSGGAVGGGDGSLKG